MKIRPNESYFVYFGISLGLSVDEAEYSSIGEMLDLMAWRAIENGTEKQVYKHSMSYDEAMKLI